MECIFCKIINKDIPSKTVYEDDQLLAFHDVDPKAPTHVLIIPKQHIPTLNDLSAEHSNLMGNIILTAKDVAAELGLADDGYRLIMNCNKDGGQAVYHIHCHVMGGRTMSWPPG